MSKASPGHRILAGRTTGCPALQAARFAQSLPTLLELSLQRRPTAGLGSLEKEGVRNRLCEAALGPVPGKRFLTPFSRTVLTRLGVLLISIIPHAFIGIR